MVDELRYPVVYENDELKEWKRNNLFSYEFLKKNGMEFKRHYTGATACSPSRATLFTGHYPFVHGVTQTPGAAKTHLDENVHWLDKNTVPAMGEFFRAGGYDTHYIGKWHASEEDIMVPGTHDSLLSYDIPSGLPNSYQDVYVNAKKLNEFGFDGWFGPEPHGASPYNSGGSSNGVNKGRDSVYVDEVVKLLENLDEKNKNEKKSEKDPWLIVASLVNPHDIVLFGDITVTMPSFHFEIDPSLPNSFNSPNYVDDLSQKPDSQASYRDQYRYIIQPMDNTKLNNIKFYYSLQKKVDEQLMRILNTIKSSSMYNDTIIIFTSDHGEQLGSHGLFQKWHNIYEESLHIPLIIHNPELFPNPQSTEQLTSHVDLIPTMLSIANLDEMSILEKLKIDNAFVRPLPGKKLCLKGEKEDCNCDKDRSNEAIFFMGVDQVSSGDNQKNIFTQVPYTSVIQPNYINAIFDYYGPDNHLYKFAEYFDPNGVVASQYELYDINDDPYELTNLAHPSQITPDIQVIITHFLNALNDLRNSLQ